MTEPHFLQMFGGCGACCAVNESEALVEVKDTNENSPATALEAFEEASPFFAVKLVRVKGVPIGLDVDVLDGVSLIVDKVKDGFVKSWNEENPLMAIQAHDRIIEVNGVRANAAALAAELHHTTVWDMTISRPKLVSVLIEHESKATFGVDLRPSRGGMALLIANIGEGFMQEWLLANPRASVHKHDRIVKINGIRGSSHRLLRALHATESSEVSTVLELEVLHYDALPASFESFMAPVRGKKGGGKKGLPQIPEIFGKKPGAEDGGEDFMHPSFLDAAFLGDQEREQREEI